MLTEIGAGEWDNQELSSLLHDILQSGSTLDDYRVTIEFANVGIKTLLLNARRLQRKIELPGMILLSMTEEQP